MANPKNRILPYQDQVKKSQSKIDCPILIFVPNAMSLKCRTVFAAIADIIKAGKLLPGGVNFKKN